MADNETPTASTAVKPLTDAQRAQLQQLQEQDASAKWQEKENARKEALAAMPNVVAFATALKKADLSAKIDAAISNKEGTDSDVLMRMSRIQQALAYDFAAIIAYVETAQTETPTAGPPLSA